MEGKFDRVESFNLNKISFIQFIILSAVIWCSNILAQHIFPTEENFPFFIRNIFAAITVLLIYLGTKKLLEKNNITSDILGLHLSFETLKYILFGFLLAVILLVLISSFIYVFVSFHFETGSLSAVDALKNAINLLLTNTLEEFIFRGFPLLVLSKMFGWRKAVCFLALPFGLFHLCGLGFGITAFKMILTTAACSFIFCYAYILTNSLFTAISAHWFLNILVHTIMGMGGGKNAVFQPKFHGNWPIFDLNFLAFLISAIIVACILFVCIKKYNSSFLKF